MKQSIDTTASWVTVIAFFASYCGGAWRVLNRYSGGARDALSGAMDVLALESLATAVKKQWHDEETRVLDGIDPVRVQWEITRRPVVGNIERIYGGQVGGATILQSHLSGDVLDGASKYHILPNQQLVVLGEPGAGKSVFATLITLDLLKTRDGSAPLPVLLRASSWDPNEPFNLWVQRKLLDDYPEIFGQFLYVEQLVARLVDGGKILPVVDGLDEIAAPLRPLALRGLNLLLRGRPMIVTCRSVEYEEALRHEVPLATAAVVELTPVTLTDAIEYLERSEGSRGGAWNQVLEVLHEDSSLPLAHVLRSPLMIGLARVAYSYSRKEPKELVDPALYPSVESIENALIAKYLPRAYGVGFPGLRQGETREKYRRARRYLPFIARELTNKRRVDIAWWQLHSMLSRKSNVALLLSFVTITAVLVAYISFSWMQHQDHASLFAFLVGIGCGSSAGVACLFGKIPNDPVRLRPQLRVLGSQPDVIRSAAVGGLAPGLIVTAILAPYANGSTAVVGGATVFAAVAMLSAVLRWSSPAERARAASPEYILDIDRAATVTQGVVVAVSAAIVFGLTFWGTTHDLLAALSGVLGGCFLGLGAMLGTAWSWYQVAKARLAAKKRLPLRLNSFLIEAYGAGILRRSGAVYQFRHLRLQEFLAQTHPDGRDLLDS